MQYSTSLFVLALAASSTTAKIIKVAVGKGSLTFSPSVIDANKGDLVEFSFFAKNHSVTQSSFSKPCHPINIPSYSGIFSTFMPTSGPAAHNQTFTIKIQDVVPIWLYCSQPNGNHCQSGMVASINAPKTGNRTHEAYRLLASQAQIPSTSPPYGRVSNGLLGPASHEGEVKLEQLYLRPANLTATANTTENANVTAGGNSTATAFKIPIQPSASPSTTAESAKSAPPVVFDNSASGVAVERVGVAAAVVAVGFAMILM